MKQYHLLVIAAFACLCVGCGRQSPIAAGKPVSGMIWEFPRSSSANNTGSPIDPESYVEVYSTLVVITPPDGTRTIVSLDRVTSLQLK